MENKKSWLKLNSIPISNGITIRIPTVGEVLDDEQNYLTLTSSLTASPFTYMVQLDDMGKDFATVDDWELFRMIFCGYSNQIVLYKAEIKKLLIQLALLKSDSKENTNEYKQCIYQIQCLNKLIDDIGFNLVFDNLELASEDEFGNIIGFKEYEEENGEKVLINKVTNVEINRLNHMEITDAIRKINLYEKISYKPGNEHAKQYLLEKERRKQKRLARQKKKYDPYIENIVIALVNDSDFPYDYDSCMDLSLYRFNKSFKQIHHRITFDNTMIGVYAGTVDVSKMTNKDCLSWYQLKTS